MLKLALVGGDVSKSLSPQIHTFLLRHEGVSTTYDLLSLSPKSFQEKVHSLFNTYDGFNITMPYKQKILPYLATLSPEAENYGAVNCVLSCTRKGFNTDGLGFILALEAEGIQAEGKNVLVLGAGGAGRSVIGTLQGKGAEVFVYEKDPNRFFEAQKAIGGMMPFNLCQNLNFDLIINCTGVGTGDSIGELPHIFDGFSKAPFPDEIFKTCGIAVDLIYEPSQSAFLKHAQNFGKKTINGKGMLFFQAYLSDCIFLNKTPDHTEAKRLWKAYQEKFS